MKSIFLFTDFLLLGPYIGQVKAQFSDLNPQNFTLIDLMHDAPCQDPFHSAYLLSALVASNPKASYWFCVVDPGVGSERDALILESNGHVFVGPDNGLLELVSRQSSCPRWWLLDKPPNNSLNSFHSRDWFAPALRDMIKFQKISGKMIYRSMGEWVSWPDDLFEIVYVDGFGNLMSGIRGSALNNAQRLKILGHVVGYAEYFSTVPKGTLFWHRNENGSVEIAMNGGSAAVEINANIGTKISVYSDLLLA